VEAKRVLWVKAQPDYEPLFSILDVSALTLNSGIGQSVKMQMGASVT
jgi:hypothetical protein